MYSIINTLIDLLKTNFKVMHLQWSGRYNITVDNVKRIVECLRVILLLLSQKFMCGPRRGTPFR